MPHAFISHAKQDADLASRMAGQLESLGAPCWIAPRDIAPAEDYADALERGVTQAKVVVFLVSCHSIASRFCRAELEIARTDEVPILPVLLDATPITGGWRIYLSGHQWLETTAAEEGWIADLATALDRLGVREENETTAGSAPVEAQSIETLLARFEAYDPATNARDLLDHLSAAGWIAHAPQNRGGANTAPSYIRLTRTGVRRATAYLNSASVFVAGKAERQALATVPEGREQPSGIYVDHSPTRGGNLQQAITAMDHLTAWTDRQEA